MKLLTPKGWLRQRLENSPDVDVTAGLAEAKLAGDMRPTEAGHVHDTQVHLTAVEVSRISNDEEKIRLRIALGTMLRQLREKRKLSVAQLSAQAKVSEQEIRDIEHDPRKLPRPRTISQLSGYFELPIEKLKQLSGLTSSIDMRMSGAAMKYAARSDDLSKLSENERKALDDFVTLLCEPLER